MTQEEKAKAYDEAREKIAVRFGTNVAEEIFSEFEESEDERIRKGLINYFNHHKNGINIFYGIKGDDILAWLEKQGEQTNPYSGISFEYNGHIWGMCARDNSVDILCDKHIIGHLEKQGEQKPACAWSEEDEKMLVDAYVMLDWYKGNNWWTARRIKDWLNSLKERYTWKPSDEKKELKKIDARENLTLDGDLMEADCMIVEQKSSWSKEDEKIFGRICALIHSAAYKNYDVDEDGNECGEYANIKEWFKKLKDRVQLQNITVTDEELVQAKKDAYNDALDKIEYHSGEPTFGDGWSAAIWYLKKKNAMPQTQWKPSDEQIEILDIVLTNESMDDNIARILRELREQLKKLKGE